MRAGHITEVTIKSFDLLVFNFVVHTRSGQCLTCTFRASCCNARLSRAQVQGFAGSSAQDRKTGREGVRGTACTGGYKQSDRNR